MKKKELELNKFVLRIFLVLSLIQILIVGFFGDFSMSIAQKQELELIDYTLRMYSRNLNGALNKIEDDLQDILSNQSDLKMLEDKSDLQRWHASYNLLSLLNEKRTSTDYADCYIIVDGTYESVIMDRSTNIKYKDVNEIEDYVNNLAKSKIKNGGWISAYIGNTGYLIKFYNYGGTCISSLVSEKKIRQILSYGQDNQMLVDFYITDSEKKVICSSNSEWKYGDALEIEKMAKTTNFLWLERSVMNGSYHIVSSMLKANILGQSPYFFVILVMMVISLSCIFWLLHFMNKEVVHPVNILSTVSKEIREGDLNVRPQYSCRNKEMSGLREAYVTMLDTITQLKMQEYESVIQIKEFELKYMHMQLKPHFFLNALSTINSMAYQNQNDEIHEFIHAFSKNIRYMFKVGLHTVSLKEEINNVEEYLELQRLMYRECFYSYFEVPEELKNYRIPQMLLHTFIENIFKHAVDINSFLTIFMQCSEEDFDGKKMLKIEIQNSGRHFDEDTLKCINEGITVPMKKKGIGLIHTKEILLIMYGQEHLLLLENEEPDGVKVTVWIPDKVQKELRDDTI